MNSEATEPPAITIITIPITVTRYGVIIYTFQNPNFLDGSRFSRLDISAVLSYTPFSSWYVPMSISLVAAVFSAESPASLYDSDVFAAFTVLIISDCLSNSSVYPISFSRRYAYSHLSPSVAAFFSITLQ